MAAVGLVNLKGVLWSAAAGSAHLSGNKRHALASPSRVLQRADCCCIGFGTSHSNMRIPCPQRQACSCQAQLGPARRARRAPATAARAAAEPPPQQGEQGQQQAAAPAGLDRRRLLAASALAAAAPLARPLGAVAGGDETFMSTEGFAFEHPSSWVVAFDRSTTGAKGDGAVTVSARCRAVLRLMGGPHAWILLHC